MFKSKYINFIMENTVFKEIIDFKQYLKSYKDFNFLFKKLKFVFLLNGISKLKIYLKYKFYSLN